MRVAVAFDHRGVKLRARVLEEVRRLGHEPVDLGTDKAEPMVDYPDKAKEIGEAVSSDDAERGIFVCGSGGGASCRGIHELRVTVVYRCRPHGHS